MGLKFGNNIAVWKKMGRNCRAVNHPVVGEKWMFANHNEEVTSTSVVEDVLEYEDYLIVKTKNSIYKIVKM